MNDDMPWIDLTPEEIQELRTKKHKLTEYGKQKLKKLMNKEPTHEEMLQIAAEREAENQVLETDFIYSNGDEYEQVLFDLLYDWWDEVFCNNPAPLDRNGEYLDKTNVIVELVKSISEIKK